MSGNMSGSPSALLVGVRARERTAPIFSARRRWWATLCPGVCALAPEADEPALPVLVGNYSIWRWEKASPW